MPAVLAIEAPTIAAARELFDPGCDCGWIPLLSPEPLQIGEE